MDKIYRIKRRSGRQITELYVPLPKPPEEYQVGEDVTVRVDERNVPCHVEIDVNEYNFVLYVA